MRVGLYDSGVGGLTVLRTLIKKYPSNNYIYYGDNLNLPYGDKDKSELLRLSYEAVKFLIKEKVDLIILVCGTLSVNCLKYLRDKFDVPIIDVVTPTIDYLNTSSFKSIGVIATKSTIDSHMFKNTVNKPVYEIATPKLAPLIERNELDNIRDILFEYLSDYIGKIDALVLGCTHYPLLVSYIREILGDSVSILDMSNYIVIDDGNSQGSVHLYFSKYDEKLKVNARKILEYDYIINIKK